MYWDDPRTNGQSTAAQENLRRLHEITLIERASEKRKKLKFLMKYG